MLHHAASILYLKTGRGTSWYFIRVRALHLILHLPNPCPRCKVIPSVRTQEDHVTNSLTLENVQMRQV